MSASLRRILYRLPDKFETRQQAAERRTADLNLCQQYSRDTLWHFFYCTTDHPCNRASCMVCLRRYRKHLVADLSRLFHPEQEVLALSIVTSKLQLRQGDLMQLDIEKAKRYLARLFQRAGLSEDWVVVGGIDLSLNLEAGQPPTWLPHFYLLSQGRPAEEVRRALTPVLDKDCTQEVVPLKIRIVTDFGQAATYSMKSYFARRSAYQDKNGVKNTKDQPLQTPERLELLQFLDQHDLGARLFCLNTRRYGRTFLPPRPKKKRR